jgi:histidinol-phosphate aminotransferase
MTDRSPLVRAAREGIGSLPLYSAESAVCAIDLSDNTNLWGPPPAALRALSQAGAPSLARYPSLYSEPLRDLLLEYTGLAGGDFDTITGCGSDDVLDSAMRAFSRAGASIAFSSPTFTMIPVLARLNDLKPVSVPFADDFDIDAEQLVDAAADITYLCSPNNPTATAASRPAVEYVVRNATGIVILDEAYAEFAPETFEQLVRESDRLLVARTFSKAFGLAGLRVGFGVGAQALTRLVARARGPYKVNAMAELAVRAALEPGASGRDWVAARARTVIEHRARLAAALVARGLNPLSSAANFLFVPTPDAVNIARELVARGILVRVVSGIPDSPSVLAGARGTALRIGVGPWDMMEALLTALDEIRS